MYYMESETTGKFNSGTFNKNVSQRLKDKFGDGLFILYINHSSKIAGGYFREKLNLSSKELRLDYYQVLNIITE